MIKGSVGCALLVYLMKPVMERKVFDAKKGNSKQDKHLCSVRSTGSKFFKSHVHSSVLDYKAEWSCYWVTSNGMQRELL